MSKAKELLEKAKEKLNLSDTIKEDETTIETEEKEHAGLGRPRYDYIHENQFDVAFSNECFIMPKYVKDVEILPKENMINIVSDVTKETHFIGKPSRYTNVFTTLEIAQFVYEFNSNIDYIDINEYINVYDERDENKTELRKVITTRYYNPRIQTFKTKLSTLGTSKKSWEFTVVYDAFGNIPVEDDTEDNGR